MLAIANHLKEPRRAKQAKSYIASHFLKPAAERGLTVCVTPLTTIAGPPFLWARIDVPKELMMKPSGSPPIVLVVEDEMVLRMRAVDIVEDAGFVPIEAVNADEAMQILESRDDISLLFTDIQMPGSMDGLKLAPCDADPLAAYQDHFGFWANRGHRCGQAGRQSIFYQAARNPADGRGTARDGRHGRTESDPVTHCRRRFAVPRE